MPAPEICDLLHRMVVWPSVGRDIDGMPRVSSAPTEYPCRWVGKQSQVLDAQGNTVSVDATAVMAVDIPLFSAVWLGTLAQLPGTTPHPPPDTVMTVVVVNSTDSINIRSTRRTLGLKRAKDTLPAT